MIISLFAGRGSRVRAFAARLRAKVARISRALRAVGKFANGNWKRQRSSELTRRTRDRQPSRSLTPRVLTNRDLTPRATSRPASNSRLARRPSTTKMNATSSQNRASIVKNRSCALTRNSSSSHPPDRSTMHLPSSCHYPSARDGAGGWRCLPCGPHRAPPHSSTRARYLSGALPFRPYSQSRAVWLDPSTRTRDLPWPRLSSSRPGADIPGYKLAVATVVAADREPNLCNRGATAAEATARK
jgi:hypothetical protein